jgi:hypothetical protein
MEHRMWRVVFFLFVSIGSSALCLAQGASSAAGAGLASGSSGGAAITIQVPIFLEPTPEQLARLRPAAPSSPTPLNISTEPFGERQDLLPLWTFDIKGSRDGNHHRGAIVGRSPFREDAGTSRVPTLIVPLIIRTHRVATAIDPNTLVMTTAAGDTTVDPTAPDNVCLGAPNNVPITLVRQSPLFEPAHFVFGATDVGTTQYLDALQRASFWKALGERAADYHVLLDLVRTTEPILIDVPPDEGLAIVDPQFFSAVFRRSICMPVQLVNYQWFDDYMTGTVIPALAREGLDPSSLPIFVAYETGWPAGDVTNLFNCCVGGYHGATGIPVPTQTYAVANFDRTRLFRAQDTAILSHEVGEWGNDPLGRNSTAPWGHTGQVAGCQANLEVGDPLTGTFLPAVTMPNGFAYHLQELAFYSWFFGAPSVGANGWYSNNGTFLTDAGPPCF